MNKWRETLINGVDVVLWIDRWLDDEWMDLYILKKLIDDKTAGVIFRDRWVADKLMTV